MLGALRIAILGSKPLELRAMLVQGRPITQLLSLSVLQRGALGACSSVNCFFYVLEFGFAGGGSLALGPFG